MNRELDAIVEEVKTPEVLRQRSTKREGSTILCMLDNLVSFDQKCVFLFWKVMWILFVEDFVRDHFHQDYMNDRFNQDFNLMKKAPHFSHMETLDNQRYHLTQKLETLVKKRDHLSVKALNNQRNDLRRIVSFRFIPIRLMHVRKDSLLKTLHHQLYVFWTLVAQEPWDLGKILMHFADM